MIDAGKLRRRITFQAYDGYLDDNGDIRKDLDEHWSDVATVWGALDPISGREFYTAEQSQSEVTHKVRIRYRAGLETAMRIDLSGRKFEIQSIIDWEERHESMLLMCKELVR